jgi:hypothetical protein
MQKQKTLKLLLISFCNLFFATNAHAIVLLVNLYNYTSSPGIAFIGNNPEVTGPVVNNDGNPVAWFPVLNGAQPIGLQVGNDIEYCFLSQGPLVLNAALYTGDTVSIVYGQPHSPSGITCGCLGSACALG